MSTIVLELHARIRPGKKNVFVKFHVIFQLMQKISAVDDRFIIFSIFKGRIFFKSDIFPFQNRKVVT